ncbi:lanthionine synthetase LanC family protein [uncultured Nocardioides sp.]|uniref:lanthionine synthetase LanC family protein n=1 Tax=uncultured Nocardioides sp. TaxID=198441 RepID=UPI0025D490D5|nr:lanthionine synthetase LanC family protein [uncultured Nocardioides sp.]
MTAPEQYAALGEAGWRWVLDQVRWDDGPWIPESVPAAAEKPPADRDGMHSGIGGLAHVLAEVRLARPWTDEESGLAEGVAARMRADLDHVTDCTHFDGLVSRMGSLTAVGAPGVGAVVDRLSALAGDDGWPQVVVGPPRYRPGARVSDATLGTAGVLLGALWAGRHGVEAARDVATRAADVLVAEQEPDAGWRFVPLRFREAAAGPPTEMPNWSHGLAGIAAALAVAGADLDRPELLEAARRGAEHLVSLGDTTGGGLVVPRYLPPIAGEDPVTFTWCHGPAGTSLLFSALEHAGVASVAGEPPSQWHRRCLHSLRTSGLPDRLRPGFWDNDGRCCGTAGVGDVFLDAWQRGGHDEDLAFAVRLGDALVERAYADGPRACWRFLEHRAADPVLPPGVGWMQGTAGIAAYLLRLARVLREGHHAAALARLDTWWGLPTR